MKKTVFFIICFSFMICDIIAQNYKIDKQNLSNSVDTAIINGIEAQAYPGAQFLLAQNGKIIYSKCYGVHSRLTPLPVKPNDMYDLASVTKSTATLLAVMRLYEQGKIDLNEKVSSYLPFLKNTNKENITITDLLFHESGLPSSYPFYYSIIDTNFISKPLLQNFKDSTHQGKIDNDLFISNFRYIKGAFSQHKDTTHTLLVYKDMWLDKKYVDILKNYIIKCQYTPKHYQYSDLGYITLQWVVESITSRGLDKYVEEEFYKPMKAYRTMFTPIRKYSENEIIPTVTDDCLRGAKEICGYTQDEVAAFMGGVAGEAGLFSSASDLFRIYQMLLNGGELEGKRYFKASTVKLFTTMRSSISHRGLGFDRPNLKRPNESPCIAQAPAQCYGHSGFTGPNVWVDPVNKLVYIFLCNRVSPYPWNNVLNEIGVWGNIQKAIYDSLDRNANL